MLRCATCQQSAAPGKTRCEPCLEANRAGARRYREKHHERVKRSQKADRDSLLKRGICPSCRKRSCVTGRRRCRVCLKRHRKSIEVKRELRSQIGLCRECGNSGAQYCRTCLDRIKTRDRALRDEVLAAYGNACACCGERERSFLQIDHKNGKGRDDRMAGLFSARWYRWLKKNGFPADYQLLCANCNWGRHLNGGICPHHT